MDISNIISTADNWHRIFTSHPLEYSFEYVKNIDDQDDKRWATDVLKNTIAERLIATDDMKKVNEIIKIVDQYKGSI